MSTIVIPQLLAERYREACANPDVARWRSLAYMAGFMADTIQKDEPDSVVGDDVRTVSLVAWQHCIDMTPPSTDEEYNSLSGVIVGWFRGLWKEAA